MEEAENVLQEPDEAEQGGSLTHENIYRAAYSSLGLYFRSGMDAVNYLLSQKALGMPNKKENRPGLVDPLAYSLKNT